MVIPNKTKAMDNIGCGPGILQIKSSAEEAALEKEILRYVAKNFNGVHLSWSELRFPIRKTNIILYYFLISRIRRSTVAAASANRNGADLLTSKHRFLRDYQLFGRMASEEVLCGVLRTNSAILSIDIEGKAVEVVAGPGVTESELRKVVNSVQFKPWMKNMQSERSILTSQSRCILKKVLIQGVDFFGEPVVSLKFEVDIVDKATRSKALECGCIPFFGESIYGLDNKFL